MQEYHIRRQDRALPTADCWQLLQEEQVGRLALADADGHPYIVPLNHVLVDQTIYFHCAPKGRKLQILQENPRVCYEVDRLLGIKSGPSACEFGAYYASAIAFGQAELVNDLDDKVRILNQLTSHHAPEGAEFSAVTAAAASRVTLVAIRVEQITGKARPLD